MEGKGEVASGDFFFSTCTFSKRDHIHRSQSSSSTLPHIYNHACGHVKCDCEKVVA